MKQIALWAGMTVVAIACSGSEAPADPVPVESSLDTGRMRRADADQIYDQVVSPRVEICVNQHRQTPDEVTLPETAELTLYVQPDGSVRTMLIAPSFLNNAAFGRCMREGLSQVAFEAFGGEGEVKSVRMFNLN